MAGHRAGHQSPHSAATGSPDDHPIKSRHDDNGKSQSFRQLVSVWPAQIRHGERCGHLDRPSRAKHQIVAELRRRDLYRVG
jgi:hypothetical protein